MNPILLLTFLLFFVACGPSPIKESSNIILSLGDLLIATHEEDDESFLYRYKLTKNGTDLQSVESGLEIEATKPEGLTHSEKRNEIYLANQTSIIIYRLTENNLDKTPLRIISGPQTELQSIKDIKYYENELYVLLEEDDAIVVFDVNADGNVLPIRKIQGLQTQLDKPWALDVVQGEIFVVNAGNSSSITVFAVEDEGDVSPTRSITGNLSGLFNPKGIAVNIADQAFYVTNSDHSILKFDLFSNGNINYQARIHGNKTLLNNPEHIIFDSQALTLIVCNDSFASVLTFPIRIKDNAPPSYTINGIEAPKALTLIHR